MTQIIYYSLFLILGILIGRIKKTVLTRIVRYYSEKEKVHFSKYAPYLIRWTLFSCKYFSLKLHHTLISDEADLHDHPWNYLTLILWGGYWEETLFDADSKSISTKMKFYRPLSLLFRRGDEPHRLMLQPGKTCWTLVFTSRKWRDWGFINKKGTWSKYEGDDYPPNYDYNTHAINARDKFKESSKEFIRQRLTKEDYI